MSEIDASFGSIPAGDVQPHPLVPAHDVPTSLHPTVRIPQNRRHALSELALQRAKTSRGTKANHERGIYGEYAVACWLDFDDSVSALDTYVYDDSGDGGYDLVWNGSTVDVKTVGPRPSSPCLLVDEYQTLVADFYVLVQQLSVADYRIIGYAPRQVVANAPVRSLSSAHDLDRVRFIQQEELFPIAWG